jgi:L-fuconolactonase
VPLLNKPRLLNDYNAHTTGVTIEQMVFVQCECEPAQCEQEVAWVTEIARKDPRISGIIAWAPLEMGSGVIETLDHLAQNPLIKGIRRIIQFDSDPDFCLRPDFVKGVQLLATYNWSFDICIAHHQLPKVIALVRQCPDVSFMLDHFGKPNIGDHDFDTWDKEIKQLAQLENVHCKLSGLVTEANHWDWEVRDIKPYVESVLKYFGPKRMVFGGDWPVVCQASTYNRWIVTTDLLLSHLTPGERDQIYNRNAVRFYQLNNH